MNGRSRPRRTGSENVAPPSVIVGSSIDRGADEDHDARRPAIHEDGPCILAEAEAVVGLEQLALSALAELTTEQLRGLIWIGLLDDGWRRLLAELHARGESL